MTRIRRGGIYRHRHCIDVDMQVEKVVYVPPAGDWMKLKVTWLNRWNPEILIPDRVNLWTRDLKHWREVGPG